MFKKFLFLNLCFSFMNFCSDVTVSPMTDSLRSLSSESLPSQGCNQFTRPCLSTSVRNKLISLRHEEESERHKLICETKLAEFAFIVEPFMSILPSLYKLTKQEILQNGINLAPEIDTSVKMEDIFMDSSDDDTEL
ncbi:MAG: hypothetical protein NTZ68_02800 [Candidatus Dependentiae bacterium]|nr:hypothetical protein [Candidatus Dependentiae bacterium]